MFQQLFAKTAGPRFLRNPSEVLGGPAPSALQKSRRAPVCVRLSDVVTLPPSAYCFRGFRRGLPCLFTHSCQSVSLSSWPRSSASSPSFPPLGLPLSSVHAPLFLFLLVLFFFCISALYGAVFFAAH